MLVLGKNRRTCYNPAKLFIFFIYTLHQDAFQRKEGVWYRPGGHDLPNGEILIKQQTTRQQPREGSSGTQSKMITRRVQF